MELAIVARAAIIMLRDRGFDVRRAWSGTLLSALDMAGVSLSLLPVDEPTLALLDAPTTAPAWPGPGHVNPARPVTAAAEPERVMAAAEPDAGGAAVRRAMLAAADALDAAEPRLTELDTRAGDGDLGQSMQRGAAAVRALPADRFATAGAGLAAAAEALRRAIGGSSGPFYATALLRAGRRLGSGAPSPADWAGALDAAVTAITELGGARPGDRTMIDALRPAADAITAAVAAGKPLSEAWALAVAAAEAGAEATAAMHPRAGRASYLGDRAVGVPDGGAVAATIWMRALGGA